MRILTWINDLSTQEQNLPSCSDNSVFFVFSLLLLLFLIIIIIMIMVKFIVNSIYFHHLLFGTFD